MVVYTTLSYHLKRKYKKDKDYINKNNKGKLKQRVVSQSVRVGVQQKVKNDKYI